MDLLAMRQTLKMMVMALPEDAAEGDEDDIEIDVVEGESRVAKREHSREKLIA